MKSFKVCFICLMIVVLCTSSIAQINWEKYKDNPVLTPGSTGEWDEAFSSIPSVLFDGSMYHLWYSKYDFNAERFTSIGYATSNDGISWTKYDDPATTEPPYSQSDPVLLPGEPGSYDYIGVGQPSVLKFGNVYHMWYNGDNHIAGNQGLSICHATSIDGITWTKDPNNPVLDVGSYGEWDDAWVNASSVVFDGSVYHMWYSGWDGNAPPDNVRIGHATAPHPDSTWTKDANNPVLNEGILSCWDYDRVDAPNVVFDGYRFYMFYSGGSIFYWRIGYAWSTDGIIWQKYDDSTTTKPPFSQSDPVLFCGSVNSWDDTNVSHCSVIFDTLTNSLKMWYTGSDAPPGYGTCQVGYATASFPTGINVTNQVSPYNFILKQNYPNPFNPSTTIEFTLPKSEYVKLKVYNILGKAVSTLVSRKLNQGNHTYTFDGKNLASGLYYYRIQAGKFQDMKKMILLK